MGTTSGSGLQLTAIVSHPVGSRSISHGATSGADDARRAGGGLDQADVQRRRHPSCTRRSTATVKSAFIVRLVRQAQAVRVRKSGCRATYDVPSRRSARTGRRTLVRARGRGRCAAGPAAPRRSRS